MKIISTCSTSGVKFDEEQDICKVLKRAQSSLPVPYSYFNRKRKKMLKTFIAFSESYFIERITIGMSTC